jgi:hypothetical protein
MGEIFASHVSDKGLIPRIYKELLKLKKKKMTQIKISPKKICTSPPPNRITRIKTKQNGN